MAEKKPKNEEKVQNAKKKKKKKTRNRELWLITYAFVVIMLGVIVNEIYFVSVESETAINNSYNPRQELLAQKNIRGQILASGGETLAQTVRGEDGNEERYYPYGNLFSHVVGYSTKGKTGVEYLGNMALLNSNASIGEKIQNEISSQKNIGDNVVTTLNVSVQQAAYEALGAYDGAVIVTEPSTGRIIAMVSKPDYNPNEIARIWDELVEDDSSSVLLNRATQGLYPPGSTFKIITALAYYRQNGQDVSGYHYQCGGSFTYNGHRINCYHGSSHGSEDFKTSFEKSCNSSFANIGVSLDLGELNSTCEDMLFNHKLDLPFATSQGSYVLGTQAEAYDVMQTAIGQGKTQISPLQMNMITCAVANEGVAMTPYLIDRIENYNGSTVKQFQPEKYAVLMTPEEAAFVSDLMTGVVENGTATRLKGLGYSAAGKTGSAEFSADKSDSHAWFTGFAPVENPKVCVTIIVEGAGSGGEYAVPVAKRIFDAYFADTGSIE
ncbi:MAG: penicillin-binding protein 2 [Lachnospiraceae bacterium]|nr:penicillin-binding protein 2 [Lachnospiraceae bacterium]